MAPVFSFGKLLKRRGAASNSPERTPRKRHNGNTSGELHLPCMIFEEPERPHEQPPVRRKVSSSPMLKEDECSHLRWQQALAGREASTLSKDELQALEDTNMPLKHRHALWPQWFTAPDVNDLDANVEQLSEADADAINADVARTQRKFGPAERATLRRVLRAYAAQNPGVGYCQGMNNIAAVFILLGFDETATLRGCYTLVQGCCPGYHDRDLAGYRLDAQVLAKLAEQVLPQSSLDLLAALDVPLDVLATEHFLTLFSKTWPIEVTARLWDIILREGSPAVFAAFLALLRLYLPDKQAMAAAMSGAHGEPEEPVDVFRRQVGQGVAKDADSLLREVRRIIPMVSQGEINKLRFQLAGKKSTN